MTRRWPQITTLVLGVLVVALTVTTGVLAVRTWQGKRDDDRRAAALQAARQMGVNLMSLNAVTAQKDLDRIVAGTTGKLKDTLSSQSKELLNQLNKTQAKSSVDQVEAGVVSMDGDSAEVMVSLNGTVTNPKVKNGAPRSFRYLMDLSRKDDRWLVSDLEVVP
jgi:Mce-associated membrane protein